MPLPTAQNLSPVKTVLAHHILLRKTTLPTPGARHPAPDGSVGSVDGTQEKKKEKKEEDGSIQETAETTEPTDPQKMGTDRGGRSGNDETDRP